MSDTMYCDVCKTPGERRMRTCAPAGWFWREVEVENDGKIDPEKTIMVYVCSEHCKNSFWKQGPGKFNLFTGAMTE